MIKTFAISLIMITLLLAINTPAVLGEDADSGPGEISTAMILTDLIVVRPLAAVGAALTTGLFFIEMPFVYHDNRGYKKMEPLVEKPWTFVGDRPLGVFKPAQSLIPAIDDDMNARYRGILSRTGADKPLIDIK